jgi:ABC-type Na+ efflux pump permease subunit
MPARSLCITNKAKVLMLAFAVPTLVLAMLAFKEAHQFLVTGAVIPLLLVAITAEQINRRVAMQTRTRRVLSVVQMGGFVLGVSTFLAAGTLGQ